jgi:hypothetical protein
MLVALTNLMRLCLKRKAPTQPHLAQRGRMTQEGGCRTVSVRHPNGAPQIPPLRFAPVGMTKRRGLLKRRGPWPRERTVVGKWDDLGQTLTVRDGELARVQLYQLWLARRPLQLHGFAGNVCVFEPGPRVEEHDAIGRLQKPCFQ